MCLWKQQNPLFTLDSYLFKILFLPQSIPLSHTHSGVNGNVCLCVNVTANAIVYERVYVRRVCLSLYGESKHFTIPVDDARQQTELIRDLEGEWKIIRHRDRIRTTTSTSSNNKNNTRKKRSFKEDEPRKKTPKNKIKPTFSKRDSSHVIKTWASKMKCNRFMYPTCNSIEFLGTIGTAIVHWKLRVSYHRGGRLLDWSQNTWHISVDVCVCVSVYLLMIDHKSAKFDQTAHQMKE